MVRRGRATGPVVMRGLPLLSPGQRGSRNRSRDGARPCETSASAATALRAHVRRQIVRSRRLDDLPPRSRTRRLRHRLRGRRRGRRRTRDRQRRWTRSCRVEHRGAIAADAQTGDGAGLLVPLAREFCAARTPDLQPDDTDLLGVAMAFLPADVEGGEPIQAAARARWRTPACRGHRASPAGATCRSTRRRSASARRHRAAHRAGDPAALHGGADRRGGAAGVPRPQARRAHASPRRGMPAYFASLSLPDGHVQGAVRGRPARRVLPRPAATPELDGAVRDVPPALLDQHHADLGARAAVPLALPQRRDQHHPGQRQLDARARGPARRRRPGLDEELAPSGHRRRTAPTPRCSTTRSSCCVRGGRDVRHAMAMLVPEAWEDAPRPAPTTCATSTATTPASSSRGTARPGSVFTDGARVGACARPQRPAPAALARSATTGSSSASSEAGAVDLARPRHRHARHARARARCSCVDPRDGRSSRTTRSRRRSRAGGPTARWLDDGLRRVTAGARRVVGRRHRRSSLRQVAFGYTTEELTTVLRPMAHDRQGADLVDGRRHRAVAAARGPRAPGLHYLKQRFAQVTNPPIDHLRERTRDVAAHAARPARAAAHRAARGRALRRAARRSC